MTNLNALTKHTLLAVVLGAAGLPASMANAQFRVEYNSDSQAAAASDEKEEKHIIVVKSNDEENKYEVKLVNGIVELAEMNGKEIDHERIVVKGEAIIFLSEDGKTLTELSVPGVAKWTPDKPKAFAWTTGDGQSGEFRAVADVIETPKVMLGINLGEPSDAVRKQLKLGDKKAIFVERVIDGLPAKKAGLEAYDVIVSIDGSDYANGELLSKVMSKKSPGDPLKLVVLRGGDKLKIKAELTAYNGEKLGVAPRVIEDNDFAFPGNAWTTKDGNLFAFREHLGPELHEKIHEALLKSGVNDEQMEIITEQLHEHLSGLSGFWHSDDDGNDFFFAPNSQGEHEDHIALLEDSARAKLESLRTREFELAELAREKARAAMNDAQRQVMELRDGRLVVRQAEEMEHHLAQLEDRLSTLEESQMDRMADLFERLLDRLESDED
jgi:hypothetical protein